MFYERLTEYSNGLQVMAILTKKGLNNVFSRSKCNGEIYRMILTSSQEANLMDRNLFKLVGRDTDSNNYNYNFENRQIHHRKKTSAKTLKVVKWNS